MPDKRGPDKRGPDKRGPDKRGCTVAGNFVKQSIDHPYKIYLFGDFEYHAYAIMKNIGIFLIIVIMTIF